jgi:hypothetical protein
MAFYLQTHLTMIRNHFLLTAAMVTRQQQAIEADDLYIFGIFDKAHQHIGMLNIIKNTKYI